MTNENGASVGIGDYDRFSYVSHAFPQSSPPRIAALANLFGIETPAVETARVLELGCSSGGNILPLAKRFPDMKVVGIDFSPRHVEEAKKRIADLDLKNAEVRLGDIAMVDFTGEVFDYVICHGVFSWVPPEAREAILRIPAQHLAPNGVAYVSYNVYPGWHLRSTIRDAMLALAGKEGGLPPADRIARARWVIDKLAKITNAGSPYGAVLRQEAAGLQKMGDYYILGEFLVPYNVPMYFHEFNAAAEKQGLHFLCETDIATCMPDNYGPEVAEIVKTIQVNQPELASSQIAALEQAVDYFMGRSFRQTLLVRGDAAERVRRHITPDQMAGLHVSSRLTHDSKASSKSKYVFKVPTGQTVTTPSETVRRALTQLGDVWPQTRTADEMLANLATPTSPADQQGTSELHGALLNMMMVGMLQVTTTPVRVASGSAEMPRAWRVAQLDAAERRTHTTNLNHDPVELSDMARLLLPLLDGTRNREALRSELAAAVSLKQLNITDVNGKHITGSALDKAIAQHIEETITAVARAGLLEG